MKKIPRPLIAITRRVDTLAARVLEPGIRRDHPAWCVFGGQAIEGSVF